MNTQRKLLARAALVATLTLAAPLAAGPASAAPSPGVAASADGRCETRTPALEVNHFFKTYRKAVQGTGPRTPEEVRKAHLTAELDAQLTEWAEQNHADPVLRAQNVPKDWKVRNHSTTATTATVIVTQIWGGSPDTEVWYTVRRSDLKIINLTDPPV
ncbi:hypothetical protein ACH4SP_00685 [Streptomyces sp. NPDC021093]|uniref:hypothetical protein n=1 Tax=Streptomyces sp. NPDC021093 TaxID=3365112 RepID=UPI00379F95AF